MPDQPGPNDHRPSLWRHILDSFSGQSTIPYWSRWVPWFFFVILPVIVVLFFLIAWNFLSW